MLGGWIWHWDGWAMSPGGWACYLIGLGTSVNWALRFIGRMK